MNPFRFSFFSVVILILSSVAPAFAYDGIVTKKTFTMASYTTVGGKTIPNVKVGWESYGTRKDQSGRDKEVILITPHFSANSHAAGKYNKSDTEVGYWDAIIGSGKAIDTDKYYVISSDTLVSYHAYSDKVITTGPATKNPATNLPYGMDFPLVTVRDFVNVQKALLDSLGITSLHAVAGLSMGAMQAMEWGNAYPSMVKRVIAVAGHAYSDAIFLGLFDLMESFITMDPKWNNGNYYATGQPLDGMREARKLLVMVAFHWLWLEEQYGRAWADGRQSVRRNSFDDEYKISKLFDDDATADVADADANHFLYLIKACQDYIVGHNGSLEAELAKIKAPVLLIYSPNDLIMPADKICETGRMIREIRDRTGNRAMVELVEIEGNAGHVDSMLFIEQAVGRIKRFLNREPYETPRRRARRRDGCS
uniref:Probable acyltransferase n=1 Tax=Candidatus Kentrum sp. SD TaxID=2126332 RepID=A0A451BIP4_9GAMM|nr:MAG: homoserine O-acetyltransferase [Candidatus Kentron sp. SD]VFK42000.1 MAG: homoserine O-acetyltransferase [Candidatus Kentron sp. SD]VFK78116.1 MAG: homoserine O-acetyltransferase [Candidatus Kentron sp. SD]